MSTEFFHGSSEVRSNQTSRMTDWTWNGAKVLEHTGKVAALYSKLPVFSRQPFRIGEEENRFKDEIRREPLSISENAIPIATVSKDYVLIQHRDVLASVFRALKLIQIDISELDSTLLLSEYGERMQWSCNLPASTSTQETIAQSCYGSTASIRLTRARYLISPSVGFG